MHHHRARLRHRTELLYSYETSARSTHLWKNSNTLRQRTHTARIKFREYGRHALYTKSSITAAVALNCCTIHRAHARGPNRNSGPRRTRPKQQRGAQGNAIRTRRACLCCRFFPRRQTRQARALCGATKSSEIL